MRILLVDEDTAALEELDRIFQDAGFETSLASDGAQALDAARKDPPDLAISEVLLPTLDGFSLLRAWLQDPGLRAVPFAFYTGAFTGEQDHALAKALGAYRFWHKPMAPGDLIERADQVIQLSRKGLIGEPVVPAPTGPLDIKLYDSRLVQRLRRQAEEAQKSLSLLQERLKDAGPLLVGVEVAAPGAPADPRTFADRRNASYKISRAGLEANSLDELFRKVHGVLSGVMAAGHLSVYLLDGEPETLSLKPGSMEDPLLPEAVAARLIQRVIDSGEPILAGLDDLKLAEAEAGGEPFAPPGFAWIGAPLESRDRIVGALTVYSCSKHACFSPEDLEVVSFAASQVAMAIQRKGDEAEMLLLTSAVEQVGEAIFITDHDGQFVYVNPSFETQSGYSRTDLAGRGAELLRNPDPSGGDFEGLMTAAKGGHTWSGRMHLVRKDGEPYLADVAVSPVRNDQGELAACVFVLRDVTREVDVQEQLHRARTFETVGMLAQGIAHEVRNPLFAINLNIAAMDKLLGQQTAVKPFLGFIQEQVRKLDVLMKDLLELGQPPGRDEFTPMTLQAVLKDAARQAERGADTHDRLILDLPPEPMPVRGVSGKLKLAFLHLFDNAFQNSPAEGRVHVKVEEESGSWIVRISDEGTGLAPEIRDKLFDPFVTTHEGHRGLGLTMVRHCLSAHHGTVTASDNAPDPGATFTVVLPKGAAAPRSPT